MTPHRARIRTKEIVSDDGSPEVHITVEHKNGMKQNIYFGFGEIRDGFVDAIGLANVLETLTEWIRARGPARKEAFKASDTVLLHGASWPVMAIEDTNPFLQRATVVWIDGLGFHRQEVGFAVLKLAPGAPTPSVFGAKDISAEAVANFDIHNEMLSSVTIVTEPL